MRERIRRKKHFGDALAAAAFRDGLGQHARRKAVLHEFAVGHDARCIAVAHPFRGEAFPVRCSWYDRRRITLRPEGLSYSSWNRTMPIHGTGMLKSPVDRNPARPPGFKPQLLRPDGVPPIIENVEILPGKNVPVAVEKRAAQMFRQRFERAAVFGVVGVDRVVVEPRPDKFIVERVV